MLQAQVTLYHSHNWSSTVFTLYYAQVDFLLHTKKNHFQRLYCEGKRPISRLSLAHRRSLDARSRSTRLARPAGRSLLLSERNFGRFLAGGPPLRPSHRDKDSDGGGYFSSCTLSSVMPNAVPVCTSRGRGAGGLSDRTGETPRTASIRAAQVRELHHSSFAGVVAFIY